MLRALLVGTAALAVLLPVPAVAQEKSYGELSLYGRGHFQGPHLVLDGPARAMTLPFTVKSIKIPEGTSWELCSGNTFTGCKRFSSSVDATAIVVRSVRPVGQAVVVPGGTVSATGAFEPAAPTPSLRGMRSEFFVAPQKKGNRIEVKPGTPEEAARQAHEFCKSIGWKASAHADLQGANGSSFLVDVLCVR
jgi:hypothetical protein